jgi:hypothetical protein
MKVGDMKKNLKTIGGSSPIFALSNYTTFGQTHRTAFH